MSMTQILDELPRLSLAERRALTTRLRELEPESDVLDSCDALSLEAFQMMDQMETEDGKSAQR